MKYYLLRAACFSICMIALLQSSIANAALVGYELRIAEDETVVANPADMNAQMMAGWVTQHELLAARDRPFFQLINNSTDPLATLTRLKITIGDVANNYFDTVEMIQTSPGITYTVIGLDTLQGNLTRDTIEIVFSGFDPGEFVRFRSDIDCFMLNPNSFCDYRSVLFDMNGGNSADNALVSVEFTNVINQTVQQMPSVNLPDYAVMKATTTGIGFRSAYFMDHVQPFVTGDAGTSVLPEPSSIAACIGVGLVALYRYGSRRNKARS